jgi:glutaryl-CoA dehydrogenase (non-decarboxylating)
MPTVISAFIVERGVQGLFERYAEGEVGHTRRQHRLLSRWTRWRCRRKTSSAAKAKGFKIAMFALDQGRLTLPAGATGLIRACRDASVSYAKQRKAFGVEIGSHQLV